MRIRWSATTTKKMFLLQKSHVTSLPRKVFFLHSGNAPNFAHTMTNKSKHVGCKPRWKEPLCDHISLFLNWRDKTVHMIDDGTIVIARLEVKISPQNWAHSYKNIISNWIRNLITFEAGVTEKMWNKIILQKHVDSFVPYCISMHKS